MYFKQNIFAPYAKKYPNSSKNGVYAHFCMTKTNTLHVYVVERNKKLQISELEF